MSVIDKALEANRNYAKTYDPKTGGLPHPKIVVVTCMDPRLVRGFVLDSATGLLKEIQAA